jgi:hypothetical protein
MLIELSIAATVTGVLAFLFLKNKRESEYHKIKMVNAHIESLNSLEKKQDYKKIAAQEIEERFQALHKDKLGSKTLSSI